MRIFRIAAIGVGVLLALVLLAVIALFLFVDPNRYRGDIERLAKEHTGRDLTLGGKLELRRDLVNSDGMFGRLSAYGFYDIGAAWKQDLPGRESAATAGLGMGLSGSSLTGYVEVAAPRMRRVDRPAAPLGAHTDAVLREVGLA